MNAWDKIKTSEKDKLIILSHIGPAYASKIYIYILLVHITFILFSNLFYIIFKFIKNYYYIYIYIFFFFFFLNYIYILLSKLIKNI